jgi:hypothetical protein
MKITRLNLDISDELRLRLKIHIARTGNNIKNFVTEAISEKIDKEKNLGEST